MLQRVSPLTKKEVEKYKLYPSESFDHCLQRLFGIKKIIPSPFKLKGGNLNGK